MDAVVPPFPNPKAVPHLWSYKELRPILLEAGELVAAEEAERRVLMLINPVLSVFPRPHTHIVLLTTPPPQRRRIQPTPSMRGCS